MLRLLGSSCIVTLNQGSQPESIVVDCIFPFYSFTYAQVEILQSVLRSQLDSSSTHSHAVFHGSDSETRPILYRVRQNYDEAQGRYLSPWKLLHLHLPVFSTSSTVGKDKYREEDCTFSLQWTAAAPLSSSMWTTDATFMGLQVLGDVTSFLPCITFFGPSTIDEVQKLIVNYI